MSAPSSHRLSGPRGRRTRMRILAPALGAVSLLASTLAIALPAAAATSSTTPFSIWGSSTPAASAQSDSQSVWLGVRFSADVNGSITAVRYYKFAGSKPATQVALWTTTGQRLALATAGTLSTTASGWQTVPLDAPVAITAGTTYLAAYNAPGGHYADDQRDLGGGLTATNRDLTAVAGVYSYTSDYPASTWNQSNYYADVLFTTASAASPTTTSSTTSRTTTTAATTSKTTTTTSSKTTTTSSQTTSTSRPGASNTGVPAGTSLRSSGALTITTPGQVIDGLDITGTVSVQASGVVIKNSRVHGSGSWGIYVRSGSVTIQDTEIYGFENGIAGDNWTASRVNIHATTGDGVKLGSNVTLQDSWIHDLTPASGAHSDGGQMQSGVVNLVVRRNNIDMSGTPDGNSALFLAPDLGPSTNGPVVIDSNFLNGGHYTVFCVDGNNGQYYVQNISITNNRFGRVSDYGPDRVNVPITQYGNVWDDNGQPLTL